MTKNTICVWYEKDAEEAANFYAATFPDSRVEAVHFAPADFPSGKKGQVITVEFTVVGVPCVGLNGGPIFRQTEAFSFQISTESQEETDRYWNAIVGNGGAESACGWCKDKWGVNWQITPKALTDAMAKGGAVAKAAFEAMMTMRKIDVAAIEAAVRRAG
ncbi:MAG: VOC family protein [Rhodoblastus sp.]|nr:VOC family protein [Rhodoblastus sp.]